MSSQPPIALIVGGSRGVGRGVAEQFRSAGLAVRTISRGTVENADHWSIDLGTSGSSAEIARRIAAECVVVERLVFCQRFRGSASDWSAGFQTEIATSAEIVETLATRSLFSPAGAAVVFVSSVADRSVVATQGVYYHVLKGALRQLVASLAVTYGPRDIRVNLVCSSSLVKPESSNHYATHPELPAFYAQHAPLRRMPTTGDIAEVVSFLSGPSARFITGQTLVTDGGLSLLFPEFPSPHERH